ncbi:glutathione S-transferase family protein [Thalassobaculum sp.]|uniref:glutathione S-transferase family protein n=1 Tax=Thalassobaculum sp. TaxID=2022740 RepID=UPI0032EDA4B5
MIRILGKLQSINVRKVLWTCDEIGLEYQREDWGVGTQPTSDPAFRAINPKGLVPVLVDGDAILTESNSIVRYLAAKHGRDDLLPEAPLARARVEEAMDWQATEFNAAWRVAFSALVRGNPAAGSPEQVAGSLREWNAMVGLLDDRLARSGPYACGEAFTVADIVVGLSVNRWFQSPIERPDFPAVGNYFERLRRRPAAGPYLGGTTD